MKSRAIQILLFLALFSGPLLAQELVLHQTPKGILIEITGEQISWEDWQIERQRSRQVKKETFAIEATSSLVQFRERALRFNDLFPDGARIPEVLIDSVWRSRRNDLTISHPAILLATGRAILDEAATADGNYQYHLLSPQKEVVHRKSLVRPTPIPLARFTVSSKEQQEFPTIMWQAAWSGAIWSAKVFRQDPVTAEFERIHPELWVYRHVDSDSVTVQMRDTSLQQSGYWQYYLQPTDRFGHPGPIAEVTGILHSPERKRAHILSLSGTASQEQPLIQLNWEMESPVGLRSIQVFRSQEYRGPWERIAVLPPDSHQYEDQVSLVQEAFYYYIQAVDLEGNGPKSATISVTARNQIIANPPHLVRAEVVREGGVQLQWQGDGEQDYGYVVHRARGYEGQLRPISSLIRAHRTNSVYLDTASQLEPGQMYCYAVVAVSGSDHRSSPSEKVYVVLPDNRPLPAPRDLQVRVREGNIILHWQDMAPLWPSLKGYRVYRKAEGESDFQLISEKLLTQNRFQDQSHLSPSQYEYAVQLIGLDDRESPLSVSKNIDLESHLDLRPEHLQAARTKGGIQLVWTPLPHQQHSKAIHIFRIAGDGSGEKLLEVSPTVSNYLDTDIREDQTYRYYLLIQDHSNSFSRPTSLLTIHP